jgi:leucyl aminopeptidase (aminopeptidase T)
VETLVVDDFVGPGWRQVASTVLKRSLGLHSGQSVIISTPSHSLRAAEVLLVEARRAGIRPVILHTPEWSFFESQRAASPSNANAMSRIEAAAAAAADGYIRLMSTPEDERMRARLPRAHHLAYERWVQSWSDTFLAHSIRAVLLLAMSVTRSVAQQYGVNYRRCQREALRAAAVDPRVLRSEARRFTGPFQRGRRVTITHPNGTHLELGLAGRRAFVDDGVVDEHDVVSGHLGTVVPGGYLTLAVDESVAEGTFVSNRPTRDRIGVITGLRWTFQNGRLVRYEAREGSRLFVESYRKAGRERDRPAVLEVGLNPELRDLPHAEDQEKGVLTLEIGHNEDFGGRTQGTFRKYAILRGADLFVDDRPLLRAGRPC